MRIFLDINVLLDIPLQRPGSASSHRVLELCAAPGNSGFIAWHSLATLYYLLAKALDHPTANAFLVDLIDQVDVGPASTLLAQKALSLGFTDTEDAMQAVVAGALAADVIVTRNVADLCGSSVPIRTPEEILSDGTSSPEPKVS